jgi:hypothetical protein
MIGDDWKAIVAIWLGIAFAAGVLAALAVWFLVRWLFF